MENTIQENKKFQKSLLKYSELKPSLAILALVSDWLMIIAAISISLYLEHIFVYLCAVVVIGCRQHSLGIISHDMVHGRFLKNKRLSDNIGNVFIAWPLVYTIEGYRSQHLRHHRELNTDKDPDYIRRIDNPQWQFPKSKIGLWSLFLRDLLGLNYFDYLKKLFVIHDTEHKKVKKELPLQYYTLMVLYYIALIGGVSYLSVWKEFLLYWIVPAITFLKFAKRLRAVGEHFGVPADPMQEVTRTVYVNPVEAFLFAPKNISYHIEHHKYPSVPWYQLKGFHKAFKRRYGLEKVPMGHYTHGYINGLVRELV